MSDAIILFLAIRCWIATLRTRTADLEKKIHRERFKQVITIGEATPGGKEYYRYFLGAVDIFIRSLCTFLHFTQNRYGGMNVATQTKRHKLRDETTLSLVSSDVPVGAPRDMKSCFNAGIART